MVADQPELWSRGRLLSVAALLGLLVVALLAGLGVVGYCTLTGDGCARNTTRGHYGAPARATGQPPNPATSAQDLRDQIAARPMLRLDLQAAQPAALATRDPGQLNLPQATGTGPVGVPTGFPRTMAGAVAQLAAIDETALDGGDPDRARAVITGWAQPGGPTTATWSAIRALLQFRSAAQHANTAVVARLDATPLMGQVKGSDGPDWAVVCVLFEVDATTASTARVGAGDCQRMAWDGQRWVIAAGTEPADAPSAWPGTDAAIRAGYRSLRHD